MPGRNSGTIGTPASAKDTEFNSRQDFVCLLEALFGGGGLQRCAAAKGWIRCLQPTQGLLVVGENLARAHRQSDEPAGRYCLKLTI